MDLRRIDPNRSHGCDQARVSGAGCWLLGALVLAVLRSASAAPQHVPAASADLGNVDELSFLELLPVPGFDCGARRGYRCVAGTAQERLDAFQKWLDVGGVKLAGVEVRMTEGDRPALVANAPIARGATLMVCPEKMLLSASLWRSEAASEAVQRIGGASAVLSQRAEDKTVESFQLMALVLYEMFYNPSSFWRPFLDVVQLPETMPFLFTKEESTAAAASASLSESIAIQEDLQQRQAVFIREHMLRPFPGVFGSATRQNQRKWSCELRWVYYVSSSAACINAHF